MVWSIGIFHTTHWRLRIVVVPSVTLWYPSLNLAVRRFGKDHELNSDKSIITSHFEFTVGYHSIPLLGSDYGTTSSWYHKNPHRLHLGLPFRLRHHLNQHGISLPSLQWLSSCTYCQFLPLLLLLPALLVRTANELATCQSEMHPNIYPNLKSKDDAHVMEKLILHDGTDGQN